MSWKLKAHALAVLSRVPGGRSAYHWLQRRAGTNGLNVDRDLRRAFELVDLIRQADGRIAGASILEIGTGWRPFVPFVMALAGAKRVVTLDVNPWLTFAYAQETWRSLQPCLAQIAERTGEPEVRVTERYRSVSENAKTLTELLHPLGIEYQYPADARASGLPENSIDIVLSSNVLEHIPEDVQSAIHAESLRILKPHGLAVHRFNPQDHYSTVDPKITSGNFLRYSSKEWHWYGGSGLSYHNRMRSRDYLDMFRKTGFEIDSCKERVDHEVMKAIRSGGLPVHPEFSRYTIYELSVDYMWLACRKPDPSAAPVTEKRMIVDNHVLDDKESSIV